MRKFQEPTQTINLWAPISLVERIKSAARQRAVQERRHVAYAEEIRRVLESAFPQESPVIQPDSSEV
jgi:hypothetical protein